MSGACDKVGSPRNEELWGGISAHSFFRSKQLQVKTAKTILHHSSGEHGSANSLSPLVTIKRMCTPVGREVTQVASNSRSGARNKLLGFKKMYSGATGHKRLASEAKEVWDLLHPRCYQVSLLYQVTPTGRKLWLLAARRKLCTPNVSARNILQSMQIQRWLCRHTSTRRLVICVLMSGDAADSWKCVHIAPLRYIRFQDDWNGPW